MPALTNPVTYATSVLPCYYHQNYYPSHEASINNSLSKIMPSGEFRFAKIGMAVINDLYFSLSFFNLFGR